MKHPFIKQLTEQFIAQADPTLKPRQEAYMRHQFPFFGVNKTKRDAIQKDLFKAHPIKTREELSAIATELWRLETREYLYTAMDLLQRHKKSWHHDMLELFKHCILTAPWWDTLDDLAANCVGPLVTQCPALIEVMDQWIASDQMWLRRAALLYQLRYKTNTDAEKLFAYCRATMHEKEFFIRKAIGWVLREYAKTDPKAVVAFVSTHDSTLSKLSKHEALRRIK
jgi:3-methyladenine DNA glycosylase AlkD